MKKICLAIVVITSLQLFSQSTPKVILQDSTSLKLSSLSIDVKIVGNFAVTVYDMKFYNGLDRTLEGELVFPLGQNQTVSKFAMEINGTLRESVVVEKELARVAYETTVRQQIDPALLEKGPGNNYKARVYPILPNSYKRIILTYEQPLFTTGDHLVYELPLGIQEKVDSFATTLQVFGAEKTPRIIAEDFQNFQFVTMDKGFKAKLEKDKIHPKNPIIVQIPADLQNNQVLTYRDYFYVHTSLKPSSRIKKKPKRITILWDASYSMRNRDIEKEVTLLKNYINYLQDVEVGLVVFSNEIKEFHKLNIKKGVTDKLEKLIARVQYDGGTSFEGFKKVKFKSNETLLFSDGMDNLGFFEKLHRKPVYTINSVSSAKHESLERIATESGGSYLNLLRLSTSQANEMLKKETFQFLGIKRNESINEVYPKNSVNVTNDFMIAGRFNNSATIELEFGYHGKVTETKTISIDGISTTDLVKRLWAQQKLSHLNHNKKENKKKIISLAKQYNLITDYTSMLILDRIEDYVTYDIEPPVELRVQFKELMKRKNKREASARKQLEKRKRRLYRLYEDLLTWHDKDYKAKKIKSPVVIKKTITNNTDGDESTDTIHLDESRRIIRGKVTDNDGALPGVSIIIKGTTSGTDSDFDGEYALNANQGDVLVFSYLGYETVEVTVGTVNRINTRLEEGGELLEEVVVASYGRALNRSTAVNSLVKLEGSTPGLHISNGSNFGILSKFEALGSDGVKTSKQKPIIVIDGEESTYKAFRKIKSEDIFSLQVYKPEDATKIFNSRGLYGLVVIITKEGMDYKEEAIEKFNQMIKDKIELKGWDATTPYIKILKEENSIKAAYKKYLDIRSTYANSPMFFIDVADFFYERNAKEIAIQILTNLIEIELDNYELIRALAYKLEYFAKYNLALKMYQKMLELRPEDLQSYRDLALCYEYVENYQKSFDLLYKIYSGALLEKNTGSRFDGIEEISYIEMTRLLSKYGNKIDVDKELLKHVKRMPLDVRVVIDWNHNDTDIDLWVIDPNGEKAYYKNQQTKIGGKMSNDMTNGFGPEEFILKKAIKGSYKVLVKYFSDDVQKISGPTILKVTLFKNYGKKNETRERIVIKLDKKEDELEVGTIEFN